MPYLGKSPSQGVRTRFQFTPNAGTTSISGADANGLTLSFTDGNYVDVYLNGVMLKAGVDYNTNTANTIAGLSATVASDVVDIVVYDTFSVFGGTLEGNVKVNNGTFNVTGAVDFDSTLNVDGVVTTDGATHNGDVTFTGASYNAIWDKSDNALEFGDNAKAKFGTGGDLEIYHDGSNSFISDEGTGNVVIRGSNEVTIQDPTGSRYSARFKDTDAVELYHNGNKKLETTSSGVTVTGTSIIQSGTNPIINLETPWSSGNYGQIRLGYIVGDERSITGHYDDGIKIKVNAHTHTFDINGRLGIGTTPSHTLDLNESSTATLRFQTSSNQRMKITNTSSASAIYSHNGNPLIFGTDSGTSDTERMRIDSSGQVMIGTTDEGYPDYADTLTVANNASTSDRAGITIRGGTAGQSAIYFSDATGTAAGTYQSSMWHDHSSGELNIFTQDFIKMSTGSTERMRIDSSGNVHISKTSSNVSTAGHTFSSDGFVHHTRNGNIIHLNQLASSGSAIIFFQSGGEVGSVTTNSSSTSYNTSSDYRLKENVVTDWDATSRLKQLKPSRFNFKADKDTTVDGFLAHEVSSIVPEAVTGTKDEVDENGDAVMQGIDQSKLVPLLVKTIQELEARIAKLEGE